MREGWGTLLLFTMFIYLPAIAGFFKFSRRHSGGLLIIAAFVPCLLHLARVLGAGTDSFAVTFLWGYFQAIGDSWEFGWFSTRTILLLPTTILSLYLLLAGGVLGLIGRNQKFFKIGGILGVAAIAIMLWDLLTSPDRWMLFNVHAGGFTTVSFGFFAAVIGSYRLLSTTRHDVLVMREDVDGLLKELEDKSADARSASAIALGEIGDQRAVEPLIKALGDKSSIVRRPVARALGEIGDKQAVEPLIKALGDKASIVRRHAARALGEMGDKQAVEPLIEALGDKDEYVRAWVAEALGVIGDKRAVEPLEKALEDKENKVRKKAKTALNKIRGKSKERRR